MTVSAIGGIPAATDPELFPTVGKKELDRADFMTLFITQLQYQDPTKPMDTNEMSTQLAQFSSMEATMKMSDSMDELLAYQTSQNNLQLLTLLGTDVQAKGNVVAVNDGVAGVTEFILPEAVEDCVVEIYDPANTFVRSIDMGALPAGTYELAWDGKNAAGDTVNDAPYVYNVKTRTANGSQTEVDYRMSGTVTGIDYDSGTAMLSVDKFISLSVSDVLKVNQ